MDTGSYTAPYTCPACQKLERNDLQEQAQRPQQEALLQPQQQQSPPPHPTPPYETLIT